MGLPELTQELAILEQRRNGLIAEMESMTEQEQLAFAREIGDEIADYCEPLGWTGVEILEILSARFTATAPKSKRRGTRRASPVWVNPDNPDQVYRGRGFPLWMREAMVQSGMRPDDKSERQRFRDERLQVQQAA
jgi:DNA-binding protein H-NS